MCVNVHFNILYTVLSALLGSRQRHFAGTRMGTRLPVRMLSHCNYYNITEYAGDAQSPTAPLLPPLKTFNNPSEVPVPSH